jgi:hypothetical protein
MSEKEEVLKQISAIKSHLVDKKTFFPYNYNACYVWSIIATVLTLIMATLYEYSVSVGAVTITVLMAIGFIVEGSLTKKINRSYDIDDCTKRQQFIMTNFLMISLFMIVLSTFLATYKLYTLILLMWLFSISLGYFSVGFVLNIKRFTHMAQFNMVLALILLLVGAYMDCLLGDSSLFYTLVQAVVVFGLAVMPTFIAWHQQKEDKVACSV